MVGSQLLEERDMKMGKQPDRTVSELGRLEQALDKGEGGSSDYSPDELFVRLKASDHHGHTEVLTARVHPRMKAIIGKLVEGKQTPIRSASEFVFLACYHFLRDLSMLDLSIATSIGKISGMASLVNDEAMVDEYNTSFSRAQETITRRIEQGMVKEARKIAARFLVDIQLMPDSDWKSRWLQEAEDTFEKLLEGAKK